MKALQQRLYRVMNAMEAMRPQCSIICCTKDGVEYATTLLEALKTGAKFVRTVDGSTDFDELYRAVLNTDPADLENLAE